MHLLLLAEQNEETRGIQYRLGLRGYTTTCLGDIRFTAKPSSRQLRRALIKAILRVDAVVLISADTDKMQLARMAVICQFAGVPLMELAALPGSAPDDVHGLLPYAFHVPIALEKEPPGTELSASQRLLHAVVSSLTTGFKSVYARA